MTDNRRILVGVGQGVVVVAQSTDGPRTKGALEPLGAVVTNAGHDHFFEPAVPGAGRVFGFARPCHTTGTAPRASPRREIPNRCQWGGTRNRRRRSWPRLRVEPVLELGQLGAGDAEHQPAPGDEREPYRCEPPFPLLDVFEVAVVTGDAIGASATFPDQVDELVRLLGPDERDLEPTRRRRPGSSSRCGCPFPTGRAG